MKIYCSSDIHGYYEEWLLAIEKSGCQLACGDQFILLGDYIDRGPDSLACIKQAKQWQMDYPTQVTVLQGNHEDMLLQFVDAVGDEIKRIYEWWTRNGGDQTLHSMDISLEQSPEIIQQHLKEEYPSLIQWIRTLPLYTVGEDYVAVHAGFASRIPLQQQTKRDMQWIRAEFYSDFQPSEGDVLDGKKIIHGHTPVQNMADYSGVGGRTSGQLISIDGGAAKKESLLIYELTTGQWTQQPIGEKS